MVTAVFLTLSRTLTYDGKDFVFNLLWTRNKTICSLRAKSIFYSNFTVMRICSYLNRHFFRPSEAACLLVIVQHAPYLCVEILFPTLAHLLLSDFLFTIPYKNALCQFISPLVVVFNILINKCWWIVAAHSLLKLNSSRPSLLCQINACIPSITHTHVFSWLNRHLSSLVSHAISQTLCLSTTQLVVSFNV